MRVAFSPVIAPKVQRQQQHQPVQSVQFGNTTAQPAKMPLVILESPFAAPKSLPEHLRKTIFERNIAYARACIRDSLINHGESPIASHLLLTQTGILNDDNDDERKLGIKAGLEWGRVADKSVVYTDLGITKGMQEGIERARLEGRYVEERKLFPGVLL